MSPYPYGMCVADADRYNEDAEAGDLQHEECQIVARQRDDQLFGRHAEKGDPRG